MAELADALDLGSSGATRAGSSPVIRISGAEAIKNIPRLFLIVGRFGIPPPFPVS